MTDIFGDKFQAVLMTIFWGIISVVCLIGTFFNPGQLFLLFPAVIMLVVSIKDLKKYGRKRN